MSVLPAPRRVSNLEHTRTAEAMARLFPLPRHDYLKSALTAAVTLKTASPDYLDRMGNREHHERVKDVNVRAYMRELAPVKATVLKKPWYVLW